MLLPLFGFVLFLLAMTPLALAALRQLPPQNQGVTSYVAGYLIFIVGSGLGFFTTVIASNWLDRLLMIPPWLWLPLIFLGAWGGGILSVCIGEALRGGRRDTATAAKAAIICAALLVVYSHFRFLDSLQINNSNLSRGRLVGEWQGGGTLRLDDSGAYSYLGRRHPELGGDGQWSLDGDFCLRLFPRGRPANVRYRLATAAGSIYLLPAEDPDGLILVFEKAGP